MEMSEIQRIKAAVPGLVWSNTKAPLEAYVRAALLRPRFLEILKIVSLIGLGRVKNEWIVLESEQSPEVQRASSYTNRILQNIEQGSKL
ncbi:MAG: hypothetical protein EBY32_01055 [Proteobacteria bacterium]|nr:hypothetical protein [Pseudomonadota bacterium]